MAFHWPFLLVALLLLWFPRSWMRLGKSILRRRRARRAKEPWITREPGDPQLSYRAELRKPRNYFDLLRGGAGGLAIVGWRSVPAALAVTPGATSRERWIVLAAQLAVLLVGLLIQTVRRERGHVSYFAPVFYLAGISVALCGPWGALFAFLLVSAVNPMLPNAQAFLSLYAGLMVGFGILLEQVDRPRAIAAGVLCFLPALLSWLTRRPLVVFARKGFHPEQMS